MYVMSCVTLLILLSLFLQTLRCLSIELRSLITTWISSNFFSQKIIFSIFLIRNLNYSGCLFYHFCNVLFQLVYLILYMLDSIRPWSIVGYRQWVLISLHTEVSERILMTNNGLWLMTIVHVTLCANWLKRSSQRDVTAAILVS